jgi:hypothetical protein
MIFVLFPQGCYGSYVARCLYYYTDLNPEPVIEFVFDQHGSSHSIRQDAMLQTKINVVHRLPKKLPQVVTVLPLANHCLDYFNNQFAKDANFNLKKYMDFVITQSDILVKLKNWGVDYDTIESAPRWVLREFFSFWLADSFASICNNKLYLSHTEISLNTNDIFQDFYNTILRVSHALGLTVTADKIKIDSNHAAFLKSQEFHNSQLNCINWVNTIVSAENLECQSPCQTIFDEAYVQHLLRAAGYELKCHGLDVFPATSAEMQSLIYKQ